MDGVELAGEDVLEQAEEVVVRVAILEAGVELVKVEEELEEVDGLGEDDGVKVFVGHGVPRLGEGGDDVLVYAPLELEAPV